MSLESVRKFFEAHAPEIEILETEESSATVALAAAAHGVAPEQIAKTICLRVGEETMLIVASGTARLDNRKFKDRFGGKARMLDAEQVVDVTSHPVGGVCPFGLPSEIPIYCDVSLKPFDEVVPAAEQWTGAPLQVHGWVEPGSIAEEVVGQETVRSFILESRGQRLLVRNRGPKPDSFRDRSEVVAEGKLVIEDGVPVLEATNLMAKCPSKYHGAPRDRLFER